MLPPNTYKGNENSSNGNNRSRELWESGMALVVDTLSVAAGNTAKDKRAKEASNRSQARGPIIRKTRLNSGKFAIESSSNFYRLIFNSKNEGLFVVVFFCIDGTPVVKVTNVQANSTNTTNQQYLIHSSHPNTPLPSQLTIAQLLAIAEDSGVSLSEPCLHLILRQHNKDSKGISSTFFSCRLI